MTSMPDRRASQRVAEMVVAASWPRASGPGQVAPAGLLERARSGDPLELIVASVPTPDLTAEHGDRRRAPTPTRGRRPRRPWPFRGCPARGVRVRSASTPAPPPLARHRARPALHGKLRHMVRRLHDEFLPSICRFSEGLFLSGGWPNTKLLVRPSVAATLCHWARPSPVTCIARSGRGFHSFHVPRGMPSATLCVVLPRHEMTCGRRASKTAFPEPSEREGAERCR